ncbi:DUF2357 domain-containing protein [Treponema sp.]|uniref:DUF2357 domain-containing protein n=1 Tax=Treponema sp. TaxID=166 RepID=UPI003FD8DD93
MDKKVTIDNIYSLIRKDDENSHTLIDCLFVQNWFNSIFEFDPITNKSLSSTNDYLFSRINNIETSGSTFWWNDRVENLVRFTENAVFNLFDMLHNKIMSEHIITHSNRVRETDSTSIRWLSKKPGRTVRQKIADSGKLMGVFHIASIDTTENRLLKAFLFRMDNILYEKEQLAQHMGFSISEDTNSYIIQIHRWLKSEDASYIGTWNNFYPNNTLLNDKNYRKIWNAWCSLQQINDFLEDDISNIEQLKCIYYFWNRIAELSVHPNYRLLQAPVFRDEDTLNIDSYFSNIAGWYVQNGQRESVFFELKQETKCISIIKNGYVSLEKISEISYSHKKKGDRPKEYSADCCAFDLTTIEPYFATTDKKNGTLDSKLIYQTWQDKESGNKKIDVDCSNSKMISINHALKTITIHDYFKENFSDDGINPSSAASIFAESVKRQLKGNSYIYLLPDEVDDFSKMQIALRHQLNIKFSNISPLPRSIARIFQAYEKEGVDILQKKYFVVDKFDDYWIVTKIIPKKSDLLLKKYPESNGIIFEHFPSTVIYKDEIDEEKLFTLKDTKQLHENFTMDEDYVVQANGALKLSEMDKKLADFKQNQPDDFEYISVTPNDNLTLGAISYYNFQKETPEVILWREHLPPLRLETSGQKLILVDERTEGISPKKGEEKEIPVMARFEMPAGKDFYEFSLYKGEKKEKSKYYAYLANESFPLSKNIACKLKLTFTYGDEQSYKLKFIPDDKNNKASFNYVLAKWETESHQDHRKLPFPDFCKEYTWEDMCHYAGRKSNRGDTSNFIDEWLPSEFDKIINLGTFYKIKKIDKPVPNAKAHGLITNVQLVDSITGEIIETTINSHRELTPDDKIVCNSVSVNADKPYLQSEKKVLRIKNIFRQPEPSQKISGFYETTVFLDYDTGAYCKILSKTNIIRPGDEVITRIQQTNRGYNAFNSYLLSEYGDGRGRYGNYSVKEIKESSFNPQKGTYLTTVYLSPNEATTNKAPCTRVTSDRPLQIGDSICCSSVIVKKHFKLLEEADNQFYKSLRMPVITVWNNARSVEDEFVPETLKEKFYQARDAAFRLAIEPDADKKLKDEMLFFLCAVHKDSHPEIGKTLIPLITKEDYYPKYTRHLSYVIGDCSLVWQEDVVQQVINYLENDELRSSSLKILASSLWRTRNCIYKLKEEFVEKIINAVQLESKRILFALRKRKYNEFEDSVLYTCCLETILAVLRLRDSEEISLLEKLSPSYNDVLRICNENLVEISKTGLLNVKERFTFSGGLKLQQAVEKYTNGDLGENEIRILSIEEESD